MPLGGRLAANAQREAGPRRENTEGDDPMIGGKPMGFIDAFISMAPDKPGVYALYDGASVIYSGRAVGPSTSIRSRLQDHKAGREGKCTQEASHFRYEVIPEPQNREVELLNEYERMFGKLPRCNERKG
jgi:hypothetical protein